MFPEQDKDFENKNEPIPAEELFADLLSELDEYDDILIEDIKKERELEQREEEQNFQAHKDAMNATIAEVMEELEEIANLPHGAVDERDPIEIANKIKFNIDGKMIGFSDLIAEAGRQSAANAIGFKAEKLGVATKIYNLMQQFADTEVETKVYTGTDGGSARYRTDHLNLNKEKLAILREVCQLASTFSADPLTTKKISVAATIKNLIQYADRP